MATTVEIGSIRGLVLDSAEYGVLDTDRLGGLSFTDVTDRVQSVSITRGKNRDLERFNAGTMEATFTNEDRFFDPVVGTAIDVVPQAPVRVSVDGTATYYGRINDWGFDYQTTGRSKATIEAADDFQQQSTPGTTRWPLKPSPEKTPSNIYS